MSKATTQSKVNYFRLPRPLWRKLKKHLPKKRNNTSKRGGRPRVSDRAVANAMWYVLWSGCQWKAIHREWFGVSSRASSTSVSREVEEDGPLREADEEHGPVLR